MNRRFRVISRPTLMLLSEKDEMVPANVDKAALLKRWIQASSLMVDQLSSVVPDADHTLSRVATRYWVADRVVQFLRSVDATQAQNRS
jgi:esterase/lipase